MSWFMEALGKVGLEAVRIAVTSAVSAIITITVVNRIKTRSDHADRRIDDLASSIQSLAEMASDLWMKDAGDLGLTLQETKISTRLRQIEQVRVLASSTAPELRSDAIELAASNFVRSITGGDFGVHNRKASLEIAKECHIVGNRYITALRKARVETIR